MFYLISYDVQKDKSRLKIMKYLKGMGYHVQKSVFYVDCEDGEAARKVYDQVKGMMDLSSDRLLMAPLCARCWEKTWREGSFVEFYDDIWMV